MTATAAKKTRGRPRSADPDRPGAAVQSLERALALMSALAREEKATLSDLSLKTGTPPSTAHRLLTTLEARGWVAFEEATNFWSVGVEAFRTGSAFARRTRVAEAARDEMRALVAQTGETANVATPDGGDVVFVSQIETSHPIRAFFGQGARAPMHASGIGKALLATLPREAVERLLQRTGLAEFTPRTLASPAALFEDLERTRARGWALDDEERTPGMRCVAAAIFDHHGEAVAGISISGPTARLPLDVVGEFGPMVRRAAQRVTERIGG
ncbi:MAG: IclR family transcriptional regulator, partial [Rhodobacteraceae bacterium]